MNTYSFLKKELLIEIKEGKLRKLLKIPKGKEITDVYTSGKKLASDLLRKVPYKQAIKMLVFASNCDKDNKIFATAVKACKVMKPKD